MSEPTEEDAVREVLTRNAVEFIRAKHYRDARECIEALEHLDELRAGAGR